jgi:hypothetical protein
MKVLTLSIMGLETGAGAGVESAEWRLKNLSTIPQSVA